MTKQEFLTAVALLGSVTSGQAQGKLEPQPIAPYVASVPEKAEWIIRIASAAEQSPAAPVEGATDQLKEIHLTKVGNVRRVAFTTMNGVTMEAYQVKNLYLRPASDDPAKILALEQRGDSDPYVYYSKGYYGVEWIKPQYYTGLVDYKQRKCFHYQGEQANPHANLIGLSAEAAVEARKPLPAEAWIDVTTQLPIAVLIDGELIEFIHLAAPDQLVLPPAYLAMLKVQEDQARRMQAMSEGR